VLTLKASGLAIGLLRLSMTGNCIVRGWPNATTVQNTIIVSPNRTGSP
jgi:hypothetical protein